MEEEGVKKSESADIFYGWSLWSLVNYFSLNARREIQILNSLYFRYIVIITMYLLLDYYIHTYFVIAT